MRKFLSYILIFFILVAIVDTGYGYLARYLNDNAGSGYVAAHRDITLNQTAPVLILGSSRAIHHYNPAIISDTLGMEVYNCGVDGNGILFHYGRLAMIMARYSPRVVIYDVIPKFDAMPGDNMRYLLNLRRWWPNAELDSLFDDISPVERYKMISKMYQYNGSIMQFLGDFIGVNKEFKDNGYIPLSGCMSKQPGPKKVEPVTWDPLKYKYFNGLIDLCKNNGTQLIVSYSPWYDGGEDALYDSISALCNRRGIMVLDYRDEEEFTGNKKYFADEAHLNTTGADRFSSVVAIDLRKKINK